MKSSCAVPAKTAIKSNSNSLSKLCWKSGSPGPRAHFEIIVQIRANLSCNRYANTYLEQIVFGCHLPKVICMFLELLQRLALMTSFFATFAWSVRSIINGDAISVAGAAFGISLALVHFMVAGREPRSWLALLSWLLAGTGLAYAVLQKKIGLFDMGFFSPIALAVCWLCLIPLLFSRMSHRARHPEP